MNTAVHFSSETDMWETPQDLFDSLNEEFELTVDVCATLENAKLKHYYTKEMDGLTYDWRNFGGRCWMNPPYGREIGKWVEKAATGGGFSGGGFASCSNRYSVVPRLDLQ